MSEAAVFLIHILFGQTGLQWSFVLLTILK